MDKKTYDNDLDENRYKYKWVVLVNIVQLACIIILIGAVIYFSMNQKVILKSPYSINKDEVIADGFEDLEKLNQFAYYISTLTQNITYANANEQLQMLLPLVESQNFDEVKKNYFKCYHLKQFISTPHVIFSNVILYEKNCLFFIDSFTSSLVNSKVLSNPLFSSSTLGLFISKPTT